MASNMTKFFFGGGGMGSTASLTFGSQGFSVVGLDKAKGERCRSNIGIHFACKKYDSLHAYV